MSDLGRRAVACKSWRWLPGMLGWEPGFFQDDEEDEPGWAASADRERTYRITANGFYLADCIVDDYGHRDIQGLPPALIPDLADPCTLGGLLSLVREAWGDGGAFVRRKVRRSGVTWWALYYDSDAGRSTSTREYATEGEALVAALDAAS